MRTYYIFRINTILNKGNKTAIYKILNNINKFDKSNFKLAKKIYSKVVVLLDKEKIDRYLLKIHMNDLYYKKKNRKHIIDTEFEISTLIINNSYIKIETTNNIPIFLKDLIPISDNMICIDFDSVDYFYLSELETKLLV
ncbi:MAG: sporulation inhibitor of replication protein SirA [Bacilli bacterium]|nr:sporulation inhibitor of replication protein SirA [Bacilli bacterium]